ncbi:amino acid ABC transporter, amino acid-binding/permease protein [Lachnospiraceae bacterium KM106-2]|nr:amino acid ABC transporter, amino acid-binding/permease protein [Lachnospiraceae bacterium KM106-2]
MKKRMLSIVLVVAMCFGILTGCGSDKKSSGEKASASMSLLESIKQKGKLVIGTASGYPPYEFVDVTSADQKVIGIDIELAQKIADKIGVKLVVQDMSFSALLSSLPAKKVDLAIAGINPTDERKKTMDFTDNYLTADQSILILKKDADQYKTLDNFKGKTLSVEKATTQETIAQKELPTCKLTSLEKVPDCILELKNGKAAGVVVESIVGQQYVLSDKSLQFSDATFNEKKYSAIALEKGNEDLLKVINEVIKENQDNGNFDKWVEEYSEKATKNAE